jgi:hypothetical protein
MRRLWRTVLVCACLALALVGAAAPRATDQTWEWGSGQNFVRVVRESASGPVTSIELTAEARCDSGPGGPGVYTGNVGTVIAGPLAVAGDGSFSYDGQVPDVAAQSHLSINGRFANGRLTGSFRYDAVLPGAHCVTDDIAFTGDCVDCPQPPPPPDLTLAPKGQDRLLVPFQKLGRAPLGTSAAAFRAKYPKKEFLGKNTVRGTTLMFFGFFDADGEAVGPRLRVYANARGRVWLVSAETEDLTDRTSWVRTASGVGIGSTLAELRRAFPSLRCGKSRLGVDTCGVDQGTRGRNLRTTDFGFDRAPGAAGARVVDVRVAAWNIGYG